MLFQQKLLVYVLLFPIIGILLLLIVPSIETKLLKFIALNCACFSCVGSLVLWGSFSKSIGLFQFLIKLNWFSLLNLYFTVAVDGISFFFIFLTTLLIPVCIFSSWNNVNSNLKKFLIAFLFLDFLLINVFCVLDLLFFYIFFESVLIPMFLIVGIWGSRERKILAAYYFFLYTLLGSVIMLLAILYIIEQAGATNYEVLLTFFFSKVEQKFIWFAFFTSFAAKIPMVPVHLWLPEAHVEAPTAGSVILAGILLKLGTYGFIWFSLPLCPQASFFFSPVVYAISALGVVYASFTAVRQTDFKRIIAYTSIAHMNLVVLGIFSLNNLGVEGAVFQSLSHGFVASSLFLLIGVVYERHKTWLVQYYGGLALIMPLYVFIFLFFTLANMGLPGTSSFIGEFLILLGLFKINTSITFLVATGVIVGSAYSLWVFNWISYGNLKLQYIIQFLDISFKELLALLPLIIGTLFTGIYPNIFLKYIHISVNNLMELIYF